MRHWCLAALGLLLLPLAAHAEEHDKDVAGALTYSPQSSLWGGQFSTAWAIPGGFQKHTPRTESSPDPDDEPYSVVLDFSTHSGRHDDRDFTQYLFLGGFRYSHGFVKTTRATPYERATRGKHLFAVFGQVLAGRVKTIEDGASRTGSAVGGGVGLEYLPSKFGGLRLQVDFIGVQDERPIPRITLGATYRFEH
jgi:hypothetical protein